jgi:hypothetical protein
MQEVRTGVGTQLFIGVAAPMPELLTPVSNGDGAHSIFVKPLGGLWTSTWNAEQHTSGWTEWCESEEFGAIHEKYWHLLTPKPESRIAVIDTLDDLLAFLRQYPRAMDARLAFMRNQHLDYERMACDYDALHLTEEGQWRTRLTIPANLYGWDCESTLWFRWCFERVEHWNHSSS